MPRKAELLNSLSRGRIRASWNKYNLFNLYKKGRIGFQGQNLYQQKWTAKQETRAYHGEFLTEKRLQASTTLKLESVAHLDASLRGEMNTTTPVQLQTYAEFEKRLDFALFRAMFASSIRQARQFILHGYVKVNGIRIRQPGYNLAPGDLFAVKPEKVLQALGKTKPSVKESLKVDNTQIAKWNQFVRKAKENPKAVWEAQKKKSHNKQEADDVLDQEAMKIKIRSFNDNLEKQMLKSQKEFTRSKILRDVLVQGSKTESPTLDTFSHLYISKDSSEKALKLFQKAITAPGFELDSITAKSEKDLNKLVEDALDSSLQAKRKDSEKKIFSEIKQLISSIQSIHCEDLRKESQLQKLDLDTTQSLPYDPNWSEKLLYHPKLNSSEILEDESKASMIDLPWQKGLYGRQENSKPYFTPWKLRPFIAPFAILPSHIEISFETCHAVYLRDPVAMPGKSEVITPFALPVHERAYMWYIRRVKRSKR